MTTNNDCKGCYTHTHASFGCPVTLIKQSDECPCRLCLIKVVCITSCDEYRQFGRRKGLKI